MTNVNSCFFFLSYSLLLALRTILSMYIVLTLETLPPLGLRLHPPKPEMKTEPSAFLSSKLNMMKNSLYKVPCIAGNLPTR